MMKTKKAPEISEVFSPPFHTEVLIDFSTFLRSYYNRNCHMLPFLLMLKKLMIAIYSEIGFFTR